MRIFQMNHFVIGQPTMMGDADAHIREYLRMVAEKAFRQAQDYQRPGAVSFARRGIASLSRKGAGGGFVHA